MIDLELLSEQGFIIKIMDFLMKTDHEQGFSYKIVVFLKGPYPEQ